MAEETKRVKKRRKTGMELLKASRDELSKSEQRRKKELIGRIIGFVLVAIEVIALVFFTVTMVQLGMVPTKYLIMVLAILLLITVYNLASQFTKAHWLGKVLAVLLSIVMVAGSLYIGKANTVISDITGVAEKVDAFSVVVLATNPANDVTATTGYTYGYNNVTKVDMAENYIQEINQRIGASVTTRTYTNETALVNALYNEDAKAIIFNESNRAMIEEEFPDFAERTKIIDKKEFKSLIQTTVSNKDTSSESFVVYVTGNDSYGTISETGRSDVNIIAVFNPKTRQVIMISTPRDYWVPVDTLRKNSQGKPITGMEKLTHAGNMGVDSSIATLESLYGVDIDYYVKVNFTGAVGVIDALGGITIQSEVDFTNGEDAAPISYHFVKGANECDGEKTLAFVRERQVFSDGDNQRGRNQMAAIKGMISKATSSAILTQYSKVLDAVSGLIATNMPNEAIKTLVKSQLDDMTSWNVMSYSVSGNGSTKTGEIFGLVGMSCIEPDYSTVNTAIELMSKVRNGEIFDVDQYLEDKALESGTTQAK